ncbi:MAG: STAS domain-containing protein [Gammaproteobacteria bacterium]|nr:STAS domain-containing protein [Gammaproteobacteria bacterium]MCK5092732.1 STAS domain-containing protein [Gammaproteobacteria bacterium]
MKKSRKKPLQIDCEESLDISLAQDLHKELGKALSEARPIVVNTSRVERVDAAIIQMFCALSQAAKNQQLALEWQEPSQKFLDSVRLLDFGDSLGLSAA